MQQATLQAARVMSQQLKGNVEIVDDNEVVGLVGPANETEIILDGKKVNSLLDSSSQVTSVSESYYREHLSQYPLQPVDVPGLLLQPAGGGSMPYLGIDHYIIKGSPFNIKLRLLWYLILSITIQLQLWLELESLDEVRMNVGRKMGTITYKE